MRETDRGIEAVITEADAQAVTNVHDLMQRLVEESTHTAAFQLAMLLETDELRDLAHACDIDAPHNREDLALAVVVAGRGVDEDEQAALFCWRMERLYEQRIRAAALN